MCKSSLCFSLLHRPGRATMPLPYQCSVCRLPARKHFFSVKKLCQHLTVSHQHEPRFRVTCGINGCQNEYQKVASFQKHLSRNHSNIWRHDKRENDAEEVIESVDIEDGNIFESDSDNDIEEDEIDEENIVENLTQAMSMFSLKMREKHVIPSVATDEVCNTMQEILIAFVQQSFKLQVDANEHATPQERCDTMVDMIKNSCGKVATERKLMKYCTEHLGMNKPVELTLGRSEAGKKQSMQYVSVLQTIKFILSNEDIVSHILQRERIHNHESDVLCDFTDGELFGQHPFFSTRSDYVKLHLQFYMDEFEVVNPLGSRRGKHKLSAVYFVIGNIHPKYRSKLENIYLCLLVRYKYIQSKKYSYKDILQPLVNDLNVLKTVGLDIMYQGQKLHFKGTMSTLSADNLSAHDVGGFQKHFNAGCVCRVCMTTKGDLPSKLSEEDCVIRTKSVHEYHLHAVEQDQSNSSIYGVLGRSALNAIDSFSVTDALPPDIMHDCLEGVFAATLQIVLEALVHDPEVPLTLDDVNAAILNFKYGQNDASNRPPKITNSMLRNGLSGKATERWCLLRLLPMILGDKVPVGNMDWKLYLLCREIADFVMAPVFRKSWITYLTNLIAEFVEEFVDYADNFPCKLHYLIHYPRLMLKFGPLKYLWCMRFEAKHQYFKKVAGVVCNFNNIALTLANRHQQKQCWEHSTRTPLGTVRAGSGNTVKFQSLPANLQQALQEKWLASDLVLEDFDVLWQCNELEKDCVKYAVGDCFVLDLLQVEEIPLFVEIKFIICYKSTWFLCGCIVLPDKFDEHMYAYKVKKTADWLVFTPGQEKDYHALDIYQNADTNVDYVPMRCKLTSY